MRYCWNMLMNMNIRYYWIFMDTNGRLEVYIRYYIEKNIMDMNGNMYTIMDVWGFG